MKPSFVTAIAAAATMDRNTLHLQYLGAGLALLLGLSAGSVCQAQAQTATPARPVPDTIAQRVLACTVCHGKEGRATNTGYFPRIAGKPAAYLYNQLIHFREGRRNYAAMTRLVEHLSDGYLLEIATHFAALDLPYPLPEGGATPAPVMELGRSLVHHGDAQRHIPACIQCHGATMTGVMPATPGLLGLPRDYVVAQLGAWQNGTRRAAAPDCMAKIVQNLSAQEVSAVASWLAAQRIPAAAGAVAAQPIARPLDCGSHAP